MKQYKGTTWNELRYHYRQFAQIYVSGANPISLAVKVRTKQVDNMEK
jgi:hypothetical protein